MNGLDEERCVHCGARVYFEVTVFGEWAHWHGDRYCHDLRGYTRTPLQVATPSFHPPGGVL